MFDEAALDEVASARPGTWSGCTATTFQPAAASCQLVLGIRPFMARSRPPRPPGARHPHEVCQRPDRTGKHRVEALARFVGLRPRLHDLDVVERERVADVLEEAALLAGRLDEREMHAWHAIASGMPGKPAPLPTSATRGHAATAARVRLSSTCLVICAAARESP